MCTCLHVCLYVSAHSAVSHRHLTAKVQHSHTHATPLRCLFSPVHRPVPLGRLYACCKIRFGSKIMTRGLHVHSILMQDAYWECVFVCSEQRDRSATLCWSLLEVKGTSYRPIELLTSGLIRQTPAEGNGGALCILVNSNACWRELMKGRGLPTGEAGERTLWQLKNYHFINSMHYLYLTHLLSWHIHLQWPWAISLGY